MEKLIDLSKKDLLEIVSTVQCGELFSYQKKGNKEGLVNCILEEEYDVNNGIFQGQSNIEKLVIGCDIAAMYGESSLIEYFIKTDVIERK